jgi:hypothetical protein
MKRKSNGIKEKEMGKRGGGGGTADTEKKEKEKRKKRMGAPAPLFMILYWLLRHLYVFLSIYLVKNPLPVDVGIVSRTTSNIVFIVVFSLPQACVSSD